MRKLAALIREAERVKRQGAGVSEYTQLYNAMLRELKKLSTRLEIYARKEAVRDE